MAQKQEPYQEPEESNEEERYPHYEIYVDTRQIWYLELDLARGISSEEVAEYLYDQIRQVYEDITGEAYMPEEGSLEFTLSDTSLQQISNEDIAEQRQWLAQINVSNIKDEDKDLVTEVFNTLIESTSEGDVAIKRSEQLPERIGRSSQPPNWGGGGPGGLPIPVTLPLPYASTSDSKPAWHFTLPAKRANSTQEFDLESLRENDGGSHAVIGILDTCPSDAEWATAVHRFVTSKPAGQKHPLLESLIQLAQQGKFELVNKMGQSGIIDPWEQDVIDEHINKYRLPYYQMVDHGIFVAGIIHSIAPKATIFLHRVLDDKGICLYNPIQDGFGAFQHVNKSDSSLEGVHQRPLIVNCSFGFVTDETLAPAASNPGLMEDYWHQLQKDYTTVVAGAGNEALIRPRPGGPPPPPPPLDPAGYQKTLGVSALNNQGGRATYSNWADDFDMIASYQGVATMGGDTFNIQFPFIDPVDPTKIYYYSFTDPTDGILGIYLNNNFPYSLGSMGNVANTSGWAKWSGTSFSTAIISGVLALIASHLYETTGNTPMSNTLIEALKDYCEPPTASIEEHMLKVTQG